jgi:hypothetical protein
VLMVIRRVKALSVALKAAALGQARWLRLCLVLLWSMIMRGGRRSDGVAQGRRRAGKGRRGDAAGGVRMFRCSGRVGCRCRAGRLVRMFG